MTSLVIPFPIERQAALIDETVRVLRRKEGIAADRFWRLTCRRLLARLQVQGFSEQVAEAEIRAFVCAVTDGLEQCERRSIANDNPNGAA
ncbi:DUF6074 family protein [Allorhizobium borbori]|uniref:Uncharacterized protein n=1 Tax=Allorhizobium borbori TaxID=485907 RepID=A0A7W6K1N5_9HYPH|nr:DUF6074 family protein [Allorhizobium borbori]MBB4103555.1 hypothetical protein [Allorhizobium borbori]